MIAAGDQLSAPVSFDTGVPLLVLIRREVADFEHCALAVARSGGRVGIPVYIVGLPAGEPATRSRYVSGCIELPPDLDDEPWTEAIIGLRDRLAGAVLVPIDDDAAVTVGRHQDRLAEHYRLPLVPDGLQERLASKLELRSTCDEFGIPTPRTTLPATLAEAVATASSFGYPVVLKRSATWLDGGHAHATRVRIARDQESLRSYFTRMQSPQEPNVLIQEYIPGGSDSIWMFDGYFDADACCRCAFTGQKLRQGGVRTGPTTLGVCVRNDAVAAYSVRLMQALGYRGIIDMGFRYDARDGSYKLLDVNPRLGSTFRLFVSDNGLDVLRAMHLDLTGRGVPAASTSDGRTWWDEPNDFLTAVRLAREGSFDPRSWARSVRGVSEAAWWAPDDRQPFVAMTAQFPVWVARKVERRLRGRRPRLPFARARTR